MAGGRRGRVWRGRWGIQEEILDSPWRVQEAFLEGMLD